MGLRCSDHLHRRTDLSGQDLLDQPVVSSWPAPAVCVPASLHRHGFAVLRHTKRLKIPPAPDRQSPLAENLPASRCDSYPATTRFEVKKASNCKGCCAAVQSAKCRGLLTRRTPSTCDIPPAPQAPSSDQHAPIAPQAFFLFQPATSALVAASGCSTSLPTHVDRPVSHALAASPATPLAKTLQARQPRTTSDERGTSAFLLLDSRWTPSPAASPWYSSRSARWICSTTPSMPMPAASGCCAASCLQPGGGCGCAFCWTISTAPAAMRW